MDQTEQDRLTTLVETAKKQKFKLAKPETEEAASLLAQILLSSLGPAHDTADNLIRALPADSIIKAIVDSWLQLPESIKRHLLKTLPNLPRTDRFDRLKLHLAAAIVDLDAGSGITFLCTSCSSLASKSGTQFSSEVIQIFRKTFLDGDEPKLKKLLITSHSSAVTGALLNLILASLFTNSPPIAPVFQLPIVTWLFSTQAYSRLKATQQTQLVETIKRWDGTLRDELRKSLDDLHVGLPSGFEFLLAPAPPEVPAGLSNATPIQTHSKPGQAEKHVLHWKDILGELTAQFERIEQELEEARAKSTQNQAELQALQASLANAETYNQNLRQQLVKKAEENEKQKQALTAAEATAREATQRANALESTCAELKRNHEERVKILTSRIDTEAHHRLESFQHALGNSLRVDYSNFAHCKGKPITPELGQGLQMLISEIFDRLERNGVNAKE